MIIEITDKFMQKQEAIELCKKIEKLTQESVQEKVDIVAYEGQIVVWANTPVSV